MEILAIIAVVFLLILVMRSGRKHKGIFTKRCPHCRNIIPDRAKVCEFCRGDVS
jgi:rRNA maturation endonuclease Nob1